MRVRRRAREAERLGVGPRSSSQLRPGERAGAQRHRHRRAAREVEANRVALEHPEVGEQVVAEVDGLRALEVRVAGHRASRRGASASSSSRSISAAISSSARSARSRTNSARSVATWSLRERPVWSLPPTGPTISVSRRSTAMWMSSSSSRKSNSPASSSAATASRPRSSSASSSASSTPARSSPAACTREPCDVLAPEPAVEADRGVDPREQRVLRLVEARHGGQLALKIRATVTRALEQRVADQPGDHPVGALARDPGEDATHLAAVEPGAQEPGAELDPVGQPHELDLGSPVGLVSQRVVLRAGVADQLGAPGALTRLDEDPLGELAALVRVDAAVRDRRVEPDVVDQRRAQGELAVDGDAAPGGQELHEQKAAHAVALHRPVDLAGGAAQLLEEAALEVGLDEGVGGRAHVQSPRRASASASQTRSICCSEIEAKNGSASEARGGVLGDRELPLAIAEALAVEAHQVDARHVGLRLDPALGEVGEHRVAVGAAGQPDRVDEPAAALVAAVRAGQDEPGGVAGTGRRAVVERRQALGVHRRRSRPLAPAARRGARAERRRARPGRRVSR